MEMTGAPEVYAPIARVWERLMDHQFVGECGPGVESVDAIDATHFRVTAGFGVGSIRIRFGLDVELTSVTPPTALSMAVNGNAPGSAVQVESSVRLEEIDTGRTRLDWTATTHIHGTLANVGARLLQSTTTRLTEQFWQRFADRVAAYQDGSPT